MEDISQSPFSAVEETALPDHQVEETVTGLIDRDSDSDARHDSETVTVTDISDTVYSERYE